MFFSATQCRNEDPTKPYFIVFQWAGGIDAEDSKSRQCSAEELHCIVALRRVVWSGGEVFLMSGETPIMNSAVPIRRLVVLREKSKKRVCFGVSCMQPSRPVTTPEISVLSRITHRETLAPRSLRVQGTKAST